MASPMAVVDQSFGAGRGSGELVGLNEVGDRLVDPGGGVCLAEVVEHQGGRPDRGERIGASLPAMSWAAPCTGSNIDGPVRAGFRLADAAQPDPAGDRPGRGRSGCRRTDCR